MSRLKAFLFDLDGTLLDSEVLYVEAVRQALEDRNHSLSYAESLELVYGKGWTVIYGEVTERFPGAYPTIEAMEEVVRNLFLRLRSHLDIRISGSIETLEELSRDYPVAIVSGSPRQDVFDGIQLMGLESHIDFYLGSEDYFPGKPDPACYLAASKKLELRPEECLVFEDSNAGVRAAKGAGMYCVGLRRKGAPFQDLSLADAVFEDLLEFNLPDFQRKTRVESGSD